MKNHINHLNNWYEKILYIFCKVVDTNILLNALSDAGNASP